MDYRKYRNVTEYERRFKFSRKLYEESLRCIPAGVNSTARTVESGWDPFPLSVDHGTGSHIYDVDGNEYIDYLLGLGPMLLGHRPPEVTAAVQKHIGEVGTVFAMVSELDAKVAEKLVESVPSMEKVRLSNTGTEAVTYAIRLARAYTGKGKIVRFEGMYHGFSDGIYWSKHPSKDAIDKWGNCTPEPQGPGLPKGIENSLLICQWNDLDALTKVIEENHDDIAAVITEPIMCNTGCILPKPGYLEGMRRITEKYGILLIFDEVITGFRVSLSGAQGYYGIKPDISVFAKAMGGGFPVAALGGRADIFKLVDEGKFSIAGTYSGNGIALSATNATLDILSRPGVYEEFTQRSLTLMNGIADIWAKSKIPAFVTGVGPLFQLWFSDHPIENYRDAAKYANGEIFALWWEEMLFRGVLFHPHYFENMFISMAHTDADVDKTLAAAEEAAYAVEKKVLGK